MPKKLSKKHKKFKGFTVPELLAIIAVIGILAVVTLMAYGPSKDRTRDAKRITEVNAIRKAVQQYYLEHDEYPIQDDAWCSLEIESASSCDNLLEKIAPYLPETPRDPLFGKGLESEDKLFSYQYITIGNGSEYKIHTDLEKGDYYEVGSMGSVAIGSPDGSYCGDGSCNGTETCLNCQADCGECGAPGCGDGACNGTETCVTCPLDCDTNPFCCGDTICDRDEGENCLNCNTDCACVLPEECQLDGTCGISSPTACYCIEKAGNNFEFDVDYAFDSAISQIDSTHYLVAYYGPSNQGRSVVLQINTSDWSISKPGNTFTFDTVLGSSPDIYKIDPNHYLVTYVGPDYDGWAVILEVNTSNWSISKPGIAFEFDTVAAASPAISQIDSTHYLVAYNGPDDDGWSVVLQVNTSDWSISKPGSAFEFDAVQGRSPAISQIDSTHYLVAYGEGPDNDGWAVILELNTSNWTISKPGSNFEFDATLAHTPAISQIDSTHYLVAYGGIDGGLPPHNDGWSIVLQINTSDWSISKAGSNFKFDATQGDFPAISQVDSTHYLVAYQGQSGDGWGVVLELNTSNWTISNAGNIFNFYVDWTTSYPSISKIDSTHYLVVHGEPTGGWAVVLGLIECP